LQKEGSAIKCKTHTGLTLCLFSDGQAEKFGNPKFDFYVLEKNKP
jgi:hypothetical protein